ncbi:MAG: hypothetical protein GY927_19355 [bacterium]|nr:hypothetical protein [bacterium]
MLVPTVLATNLENQWLPGGDGPFADNVQQSADKLASVIANWFAQAQAASFPCSTAMVRKSQLMAQLIPALDAKDAQLSGIQIAQAFMAYVAGQSFGVGIAAPPAAAAGPMIASSFANLEQPQSARAQTIATALHLMALSSIVSFPIPPFASPVF